MDGAWGTTPTCVVSATEKCFEHEPQARPALGDVVAALETGIAELSDRVEELIIRRKPGETRESNEY